MAEEEEKQTADSEQQTDAEVDAAAEEQAASSEQQAAPEAEEQAADSEQQTDAEAETPAEASGDEEPAVELSPKQRRKLARSTHEGEPNPPLSVDERIERRAVERRRKAGERRRYRQGRGAARAKAAGKGSGTGTEPAAREPGSPKVRQGVVVSDKMDKTITVRVESARRHPAYEKVIRTSKMYHAHDERNEAGAGDTVRLVETRPMSKTKRWRLTEILEKAK
jgi:small subunit ribosomal protein S17